MKKLIMVLSMLLALCLCACNTPLPPNDDEPQTGEEIIEIGNEFNIVYAGGAKYDDFYLELDTEGREYIGDDFPKTGSYYQIFNTNDKIVEKISNVTNDDLEAIDLENNYFVVIREAHPMRYIGKTRKGENGFKNLEISDDGASVIFNWHEIMEHGCADAVPREPEDYSYTYYYLIVPKSERKINTLNTFGKITIQNSSIYKGSYNKDDEGRYVSYWNSNVEELPLEVNTAILFRGNEQIKELNEDFPTLNLPLYPDEKDNQICYYMYLYLEGNAYINTPECIFYNLSINEKDIYITAEQNKAWKKTRKMLYMIKLPSIEMRDVDLENAEIHLIVSEYTTREKIPAKTE